MAHAAAGPVVSSWVTTPDRAQLLSPGPSSEFDTTGTRPAQMIDIDSAHPLQVMDGFGASITDSSATLLYRLGEQQREEVMRSIFHPTDGIGMSFLRQPIGASDFVDGPHYTYDDLPLGQTDYDMTHFSIAHDTQILALLRQARQLNSDLKVMATSWGQPAWMKDNNSLIGGRLKNNPAIFRAYALYLVKFVQDYESAGVPIYALSVQNEPQNRTPDGYPGTDMPVAYEAAVINELGPMLHAAGLGRVKIISYDHNWTEHPDDLADAARLGVDPEPNYPYDILRTSAAHWISGTGYHCYAGDPTAQTALHNAFPDKDIWFTECSGWHGVNDPFPQYFSDTLKWHARNLVIGTTRNWAKTVVNWNLALNPRGGPVNGGCGNNPARMCTGVITIDGTTVTRNAEYYTLGHLSKFVKPGAVRLNSNNVGDLLNSAFRNADGSIALVVTNTGGGEQTFGVSWNGKFVRYTLPAGAIATLTWDGTPPDDGSIDPTKWYQTINQNSGKCVDATDWGTSNSTPVQQWACSVPAADNQLWQFRPTDSGFYHVVNRHGQTMAWDVTGGPDATSDRVPIQLWAYAGGTNQQWQPTALGGGYYTFAARHSGKCLDVTDVSTSDGTRLQQWTCTDGPAQSFRLAAQP